MSKFSELNIDQMNDDVRKEKPAWLKKAYPDKPWKYKYKTETGLIIEPYNFNTPIGFDVDMIESAIKWIDWKMENEK